MRAATALNMDVFVPALVFSALASKDVDLGAFVRPIIGALLAWAIAFVLALPPEQASILIVFAALPPAVLNAIFAERYDQEPERVASIVLLGNAAALITLPAVLLLVL
ncbi:AEC family transporter [Thiocapsa sp.]|uniref:AEC family transporter n=1 Tax=Thiocapsa sp. TaxID=2024551 RepID=UPI002C9648D4|nr:AEC family transporter [Thiocapsa sp.]HSO84225.1 AEC family transporter [Thiocapsa sp.]